jgi:hypothetical protein
MAKRANGDVTAQDRKERLIASYQSSEKDPAVVKANHAMAGYGYYGGEGYGGNLFAPPVEFAGSMGYGYGGTVDPYSNIARYGGVSPGMMSREGWVYGRGGNINLDHQRIAQCILLYKTEGVVQTVVHLLADFVVESVDIVHPDETVHNFYKSWATKVKLKRVLHRVVVDLLVTGNVFLWTKLAKLKPNDAKDMKKGIAAQMVGDDLVLTLQSGKLKEEFHRTIKVEVEGDEIQKLTDLKNACEKLATAGNVNEVMMADAATRNDPGTESDPSPEIDEVKIPWGYISLNPLQMEPRGSRFANEHYWVMMINQRDVAPLSKFMTYRYYTDISTTKINLPEIFKGKLNPVAKNRQQSGYAAELQLDEKRLSVIQDVTKADYEDWATPQIYPAFKEVMFKRQMRQGEISAMESIKHTITLIKLGDTKEGFAPTEAQIERVAAALAGGGQTHHLVWDDLISGEVLAPNLGNIFDPKKYEEINKDIYAALGISESVMTGQGSYANSFLSIKLLLEKLETIRDIIEDWLRVELKHIAEVMKFKRLPQIVWGLMSLRDENAERKLWLDLYDRGIISDTTMLEQFGSDFDIELERQKLEKSVKEEENPGILKTDKKFRAPVMVTKGPFNKDPQPPKPLPKKKPLKKGGRPVKTGKPQTKKRNTKPKGMGMLQKARAYYNFALNAYNTVSDIVAKRVVAAQNVKDVRSLSKAQKIQLDEMITWTVAALNPDESLTNDLVYNLLDSSTHDAFDSDECRKVIAIFQAEAHAGSSKEEKAELLANAFALVRCGMEEEDNE